MVCTGAKSEDDSRNAAEKYARMLDQLGNKSQMKNFKVQNVVASVVVNFSIRLEQLAYSENVYCHYEPELFPGLVYRMTNPKVVLLIFVSGKIVLTGAKSDSDIQEAFKNIYPKLVSHRKEGIKN
eukprot:TRINITY_DN1852_c0_g2_i2.p1 TRINITY_DN1852_c0_g2~~TRINITY_DN1852_c0_g2_i2.p1  ORF type:complete len:125 (+),score=49.46 TRINITY_DN1852_c0_g2_i2:200-574(+)